MPATRYISAVLAFIAVLLAFAGPKTDDSESGLASIEPAGWAAIGLAIVALAISIWTTRNDLEKLKRARAQGDAMRNMASARLDGAFRDLEDALVLAVFAAFGNRFPGNARTLRGVPATELATDEIVSRLSEWDSEDGILNGPYTSAIPGAPEGPFQPVDPLILERTHRAAEELRESLEYAAVLDADLLDAIQQVLDDRFLRYLLTWPELRDKFRRVEDAHLPFPFLNFFSFESASSSPDDYRRFCALLQTAVMRTPDRVEVPTELVSAAMRSGSGV